MLSSQSAKLSFCDRDGVHFFSDLFPGGYEYYPDFSTAAKRVLRDFREGKLGKINLDRDKLKALTNTDSDVKL